jgi:hypothetical protein
MYECSETRPQAGNYSIRNRRESLLYSAEGKVIHVLNPTAKLVWELCDGMHTIEDMERELRMNLSTSKEHNVVEDIKRTLDLFVSKGIIDKTVH